MFGHSWIPYPWGLLVIALVLGAIILVGWGLAPLFESTPDEQVASELGLDTEAFATFRAQLKEELREELLQELQGEISARCSPAPASAPAESDWPDVVGGDEYVDPADTEGGDDAPPDTYGGPP